MNENIKAIIRGRLTEGVWSKRYKQTCLVHDPEGISPTVTTFGGGGYGDKDNRGNKKWRITATRCSTSS